VAYFRACNYHAHFHSLTVKVGQRQQKTFTLYFDPSFLYGSPFPLIPTLMPALHVQTHLILIATLVAVFKLMYNLVNCLMSVHVLLESLPESLPESLSNKPSALIWHADVACCMARRCYSTRCWVRTFCATRTAEGMPLYRYTSSPRTTSPPGALGPAAAKGAPRYTFFINLSSVVCCYTHNHPQQKPWIIGPSKLMLQSSMQEPSHQAWLAHMDGCDTVPQDLEVKPVSSNYLLR
jgi:hypothetical protein